jgi:hypothetical protein
MNTIAFAPSMSRAEKAWWVLLRDYELGFSDGGPFVDEPDARWDVGVGDPSLDDGAEIVRVARVRGDRVVACAIHDDCLESAELGAACWLTGAPSSRA